ncbi:hypothetical protein Y032_0097g2972 [Ancylostoma ceylanicum]|uniref:Uncharacterized protein n=1 Tax=Ancylostoma ceylanicum TaxID=53326 RepID=A0A016TJT5_9BILA|nr:hypothetical protein Y032_0097g2972 [Ancylostoma ceylanicum]
MKLLRTQSKLNFWIESDRLRVNQGREVFPCQNIASNSFIVGIYTESVETRWLWEVRLDLLCVDADCDGNKEKNAQNSSHFTLKWKFCG